MKIHVARRKSMALCLAAASVLLFLTAGCRSRSDDDAPTSAAPEIAGISPFSGPAGTEITVTGSGFGSGISSGSTASTLAKVTIAGTEIPAANITSHSSSSIVFTVPAGAATGILVVKVGSVSSNGVPFFVSNTTITEPDPDMIVIDPETGSEIVANQLLILVDGANPDSLALDAAYLVSGTIIGRIPLIDGYQLEVPSTTLAELQAIAATLEGLSYVDTAVPNTALSEEADDIYSSYSSSYDVYKQPVVAREYHAMNLGPAWNLLNDEISAGSLSMLFTGVGVAEAGINFRHQEMLGYSANARSQGISVSAPALTDPSDEADDAAISAKYHGTAVASIIAASNDGRGTNGVLSGVRNHGGFNIFAAPVTPRKLSSGVWGWYWGYLDNMAFLSVMVEEVQVGVVNMSFGHSLWGTLQSTGSVVDAGAHPVGPFQFNAERKAFATFFHNAMNQYPRTVFVASAGNGNIPASYHLPGGMAHANLIAVGNVSANGFRSASSNYGGGVDLAAVGSSVYVPWWKASARSDYYQWKSGTSIAAPFVTATVALIQAINPNLRAVEIKRMLVDNSRQITNNESGLTITAPHPDAASKSCMLDIHAAVQAAINGKPSIATGTAISVAVESGKEVSQTVTVTIPAGAVLPAADVVFLVDTSGSFGDDIDTFQASANDIITALQDAASDVRFGVASFADFPFDPYGDPASGDEAFVLDQAVTDDTQAVVDAIDMLDQPLNSGVDWAQCQIESLYQAATAAGRDLNDDGDFTDLGEIAQLPLGWRSNALPFILLATDAPFHDPAEEPNYPGPTFQDTIDALTSRGIKVIGLMSGGTIDDVITISNATGGSTHQLSDDSSEVVAAVQDAVNQATSSVDVSLVGVGDVLKFVKSVTPAIHEDVQPGQDLVFTVTFEGTWPCVTDAVFAFNLEVRGEGVAIIQQIPVSLTVVPKAE